MFRFGAFQLDALQGLRRGDREIRITPKSLSLLCFLAERAGVIVSKEEIFRKIWPDTNVSDAALSSCIRELRGALHDDAKQPRFIETLHRRGYRFVASVLERKPAEVLRSRAVPFPVCHAPVVGREHQIRQLENAWQLASQGVRQILLVSGHAGVGKTTTVLTFLTKLLERSQAQVTWGQCVQHFGAGEPYEPILDALNRLCHQQDGEQFVSVIERHGPTWLAQLPSLLPTERYLALQQAIAGTTRERMLRELTDTLETITAEKPLILWLEDLHWSDRSTLDWIVAFAQRSEAARLLLVGTFRSSEVASTDHPLACFPDELQLRGQCGHIALAGLDEAAVESYITMRYPQWEGPTTINQLAQLVHSKTEGNPLFVINVLGELEGRNLIKERDGAWALPDRISQQDLGVSLSLWRAIETQIDRLGPEERNLLEVASVAGGRFASSTVAALAGVPAGEADELLRSLVRRQRLICFEEGLKAKRQETAQEFTFLHVLYRDALYKRISGRRLEDLHLRVGKIKQAEYGDAAKESAAELAMHFELGREFNLAIQYFEVAGKTARQRSAYTEARMHFDRAIALLRHVSDGPEKREREAILYAGLGGVLMATYGFGATEAEAAFSRSRLLCDQLGDGAQLFPAQWGLWLFYWGRCSLGIANQFSEGLLATACKTSDPGLILQAHHAAWATAYSRGEILPTLEHTSAGLRLYDQAKHSAMASTYGDHDAGVCCLSFRARALTASGETLDAVRTSASAIQRATDLAQPLSLAIAYVFAASVQQMRRDPDATIKNAEAAIALAEEQGLRLMLAWAEVYAGWANVHLGRHQLGLRRMENGIQAARKIGTEQSLTHLLGMKADVCLLLRQPQEGLRAIAQAEDVVRRTDERYYESELFRLKGELQLGHPDGEQNRPERYFIKAMELARLRHARLFELRAAVRLARMGNLEDKRGIELIKEASGAPSAELPAADRADLRSLSLTSR